MSSIDGSLDSFFDEINQLEDVNDCTVEVASDVTATNTTATATASDTTTITAKSSSSIGVTSIIACASKPQINSKSDDSSSNTVAIIAAAAAEKTLLERAAAYNSMISSQHFASSNQPTQSLPSSSSSYSQYPYQQQQPQPQQQQQSSEPIFEKATDRKFVRVGGGEKWVDETLAEWPKDDYRLFVGDIAKETTTDMLTNHFKSYPSFAMARVVRPKKEVKGRGYGFVSFLDPMVCARAMREQNGKYLGQHPMRITRASWETRDIGEVRKKESKKRKLNQSLGL